MKKTWWQKVWASRTVWGFVGGALAWVLSNGVESLTNLRKLPSEVQSTYHMFQSWYYDDALWTGTWSSREEGHINDYEQAEMPLKLSLDTQRGKVSGAIFNRAVCDSNPMFSLVFVEGDIVGGKLVANASAYIGGKLHFLYSFSAIHSDKEPVITLSPLRDPHGFVPPGARLVRRIQVTSQNVEGMPPMQEVEHHDLQCAESPFEYLQRLRREGVLKGVEELGVGRKPKNAAK